LRSNIKILSVSAAVLIVLGLSYVYLTTLSPQEATKVTLTIPQKRWHALPFYAGVELGIFKQHGIDLEILVSAPPSTGIQALIEGSAQFSAIAESGAIATLRGADLKIIAWINSDLRFYLVSQPEIQSIEDLRGGVLAVQRVHSLVGSVTSEILRQHGLTPNMDVELIGVGGEAERLAALEHGTVDAAILAAPEILIAQEKELSVLLESSQVMARKIVTSLSTSQRMIEDQPEVVSKMVKAHIVSMKRVLEHPEDVIPIAMDLFDVDEEEAWEIYNLVAPSWGYRVPRQDVQALFDIQNSFLEEPVEYEVEDFLDYSFMNAILTELDEEPIQQGLP
jgi:NitT/TauT family transport system substrate-binding protein